MKRAHFIQIPSTEGEEKREKDRRLQDPLYASLPIKHDKHPSRKHSAENSASSSPESWSVT